MMLTKTIFVLVVRFMQAMVKATHAMNMFSTFLEVFAFVIGDKLRMLAATIDLAFVNASWIRRG